MLRLLLLLFLLGVAATTSRHHRHFRLCRFWDSNWLNGVWAIQIAVVVVVIQCFWIQKKCWQSSWFGSGRRRLMMRWWYCGCSDDDCWSWCEGRRRWEGGVVLVSNGRSDVDSYLEGGGNKHLIDLCEWTQFGQMGWAEMGGRQILGRGSFPFKNFWWIEFDQYLLFNIPMKWQMASFGWKCHAQSHTIFTVNFFMRN